MHASTSSIRFTQPPPKSNLWREILHWCISAMPADDDDVAVTASLLSYAHHHGGLTEKQARHAELIWKRLKADYELQQ